MDQRLIPLEALADWCRAWLGAEPIHILFETQQISAVVGVRLSDGREVVVKVRTAEERIRACVMVQRHLRARGFPCPELLAGPAPLGDRTATAEVYVPDGAPLPRTAETPRRFAEALAQLVTLASSVRDVPSLEPAPHWMHWDHRLGGTWPPDPHVDLNADAAPAWLEDAGERSRRRLLGARALTDVIGHADWESQNLSWSNGVLHVVHDWDSLVRRPEATIAGVASMIFPSTGTTNEPATVVESETFLGAYEAARGRRFSDEERELAWAAGLWIGAWKAKKAWVYRHGGVVIDDFRGQAAERARRSRA